MNASSEFYRRLRLAALGALGPTLSITSALPWLVTAAAVILIVVGVGGIVVSRRAALQDSDVAERVLEDSLVSTFIEATIVGASSWVAITKLFGPGTAATVVGLVAAGCVGIVYPLLLRRSARDNRQVADEDRLVAHLELGALAFETCALGFLYYGLESLRQELIGSSVGADAFFLPFLAMLPLATLYYPLVRFRLRATQADVGAELFTMLAGYLVFMFTPAPLPL